MVYDVHAPKRPVNLSLNEDLVRRMREVTGNLSEQVERLLAEYLAAEQTRRQEAESRLDRALDAWNEFGAEGPSFADANSTL